MPKPRDAGVYKTPMPDGFKIVGDDFAPLDDAKAMPADCPTPEGCRPNGCHGACLPQSEPTKPDMRKNFEEWARDAQELDTRHRDSDSSLDRQQYESWVTALAWEAWCAAAYETWSMLMNEAKRREVERSAARCAIPLPVMRTDASNVIAYKFQAPDGSYWYIKADDRRTLDYWRDKRKLIPLTDDKARIAAGVVVERPNVNSQTPPVR